MRRDKLAVYLHLVWATWDRLPLITPAIERPLLRGIADEACRLGCSVIAINAMLDHVHLAVTLPSTITIAELLKQAKGASSRLANAALDCGSQFKWQGTYGAFTVSRWDLKRIVHYIRHQKEHHGASQLVPEWEECYEEIEAKATTASA